MLALLSLIAFCLLQAHALKAEEPDWSAAEAGLLEAVVTGERLLLADGRELRLAGIRAPRAPLSYRGIRPWQRERAARKALEAQAQAGETLHFLKVKPAYDRHRRLLVQARSASGLWLQERLLAQGAVLLDRMLQTPPTPLLAAEDRARRAGRGLWADPAHRALPAEAAAAAIGRFAVVEGRVQSASRVQNLGYLNFDEDWREDFTIRLRSSALRDLGGESTALEDYAGRRVRVRGWVFYSGGPMIEVRRLSEIERLED